MKKDIIKEEIEAIVASTYEKFKSNTDGKNADYIPFLANVPSELFGISLCLPSGDIISYGDVDYKFGIESISKVPTAILAMQQYGDKKVLDMIGADATGLPFNSVLALLMENNHPSTPLVNAGAISACSMITPVGDSNGKWDSIVSFVNQLTDSELSVIEELYKSETDTNYNNRAISWMLKGYDRIYDNPDMSLDIYTRQCSLGITAKELSIMAATIANKGVNPVTGEKVFDTHLSPKITAMVAAVGFYEHTGKWMFESGIPAKSGVGGGVMGIMPGVFGIAAFSPQIDASGNSVRSQLAIKSIMEQLELGIYE